jgi:hypothetical protein
LLSCACSLGSARELYWREASVGVNRAAYYCGRILADIPKLVLLAFFFVAPLVAIAPFRAPVEYLYAAILTNMTFIFALGYAISATIPVQDAANLTAVVLSVIMNCASPPLPLSSALLPRGACTRVSFSICTSWACVTCMATSILRSTLVLEYSHAVFSGFVGLLGNNAVWAYTRWVQRSYIALELMEGLGFTPTEYNAYVFGNEFNNGNWRLVSRWRLARASVTLLAPLCSLLSFMLQDLSYLLIFIVATHILGFVILILRHRQKQR